MHRTFKLISFGKAGWTKECLTTSPDHIVENREFLEQMICDEEDFVRGKGKDILDLAEIVSKILGIDRSLLEVRKECYN